MGIFSPLTFRESFRSKDFDLRVLAIHISLIVFDSENPLSLKPDTRNLIFG